METIRMTDCLLMGQCNDCGSWLTFSFTLAILTHVVVNKRQQRQLGIVSFAKCPMCHARGDKRSCRILHDFSVDEIREAVDGGLIVLDTKH